MGNPLLWRKSGGPPGRAKICVVGYTHPFYDKRVLRTVLALSESFPVVYIHGGGKEKYKGPLPDSVRDIEVKPPRRGHIPLKLGLFPTFLFDLKVLMEALFSRSNVWLLHDSFRTLPGIGLSLARNAGIRIIYDIHEFKPEWLAKGSPIWKLFPRGFLYGSFKADLLNVSGAISVNRFIGDFAQAVTGFRALTIPNLGSTILKPRRFSERRPYFVVVGKEKRGIRLAMEIVRKVKQRTDLPVKLLAIGIGSEAEVEHKDRGIVEVKDFMPYEKMMEEINMSLFGIMVFRTAEESYMNDIYSLPHKFFDTLCAGTPVIVDSYFKEMSDWVERRKIGVVVDAKNTEGSANLILRALERKNYATLVSNLRKHQEEFAWGTKVKEAIIRFVLGQKSPRTG